MKINKNCENKNEWYSPDNDWPVTIFYQGIMESQAQCANYMGDRGFITTTNEHVLAAKAIDVIHTSYIAKEIDEVVLFEANETPWYQWISPITWTNRLMEKIVQKRNKKKFIVNSQNSLSDKSVKAHTIDFSKVSLAQDIDINCHKAKWDECELHYPHAPKILYGFSRGAATTFNALASFPKDYSNVKLVVLEGCFDSIEHSFSYRFSDSLKKIKFDKFAYKLLQSITAYSKDGVSPIKLVNNFPETIPVVFITSKIDYQVHPECVKKIATELANRRKNDVYLLELNNSRHAKYMSDDVQDAQNYQNFIHAMYKKYDLAYIPAYAESGAKLIKETQL